MDYSKFNGDEFDGKEWINSAFKAHNKEGNIEQYATTLVMKLQMFMQEVNNVIDDSCQQVVNNLPRVNKELEAVKQEAVMLQEQMKMAKYDIEKVEHDTALSMQSLVSLDCIKSNMQEASDALKEADNWTSLSADVDDVFESQDVDAIAKKIVGMQQSLHILTDVPDYSERCQYLEVLKNRLEATSSPSIVAAFTNLNLEVAQKFSGMFQDIGRTEQLSKYYNKCQKTKVLECWKEACDGAHATDDDDDDDDTTSSKSIQRTLDAFYDKLLAIIQAQIKWSEQVFASPIDTVFHMLCESFKLLHPSPSSLIHQFIQSSSSSSSSSSTHVVDALIAFKVSTEHFVSFLERWLTDQQLDSCKTSSIEHLLQTFYSPLVLPTKHLPKLEQAILTHHLDNVKLDHSDFMESTSLLQQSINKIFNAASHSNSRCMKLSKGVAYVPYLAVLKEYLISYVMEVSRVMTNIFEKCKPLQSNTTTITSSSSSSSFHLDTDEWTHFQNSLRLILLSGELISRLEDLTKAITSDVISISATTGNIKDKDRPSKRRSFEVVTSYLITSADDKKALHDLVSSVQEDAGKSLLSEVMSELSVLCACVHRQSFDIVFNPLKYYFNSLLQLPVWSSEVVGTSLTPNLPDFSFVPQEYITNVGQYLMTLPQQLDPFSNEDNRTMRTALVHGDLPYLHRTAAAQSTEHLADVWLGALANACMDQLVKCILQIPHLTPPATKQLLVDINYLVNVLEDLGLPVSDDLEGVKRLLGAAEEDYVEVGDSCPIKFVTSVANMRGIGPIKG